MWTEVGQQEAQETRLEREQLIKRFCKTWSHKYTITCVKQVGGGGVLDHPKTVTNQDSQTHLDHENPAPSGWMIALLCRQILTSPLVGNNYQSDKQEKCPSVQLRKSENNKGPISMWLLVWSGIKNSKGLGERVDIWKVINISWLKPRSMGLFWKKYQTNYFDKYITLGGS